MNSPVVEVGLVLAVFVVAIGLLLVSGLPFAFLVRPLLAVLGSVRKVYLLICEATVAT